jgi:hypothetical protein
MINLSLKISVIIFIYKQLNCVWPLQDADFPANKLGFYLRRRVLGTAMTTIFGVAQSSEHIVQC